MSDHKRNNPRITVCMPEDIAMKIAKEAEAEMRSFSSMITTIAVRYFGYKDKELMQDETVRQRLQKIIEQEPEELSMVPVFESQTDLQPDVIGDK